jgi:hypothetical protein
MKTLVFALLATTTAACATDNVGSVGSVGVDGTDLGTPGNPDVAKTGPYKMTNHIDLTAEAVIPPEAEAWVSTLRTFSTNPARGLIQAADAAGVPALQALYDALPDQLTDKFEGWVNDQIANVQVAGHPITDYTAQVVAYFDIALTHFDVDSDFAIADDGTTTHTLTRLDLSPTGLHFGVPIGGVAADILTQNPDLQISAGGALAIGEQHFGLNYGQYAWDTIEAMSTEIFGAGVREALGAAVNCPGVAHDIANKCVLGVCVGHEGTVKDICEGGLDALVGFAHDGLTSMRIEGLHLASGTATLVDDDGDGVGDRITDGTWEAELNLGMGLRHTPAQFEATR